MIVKQGKKDILAIIYITILTVIAFVYGLTVIPSPAKERNITADHKRVVDLGELQYTIDNYYQTYGTLPNNLSALTSNQYDSTSPLDKTDPQTKKPYEYHLTGPVTYKLCATFLTASSSENLNDYDDANPDYSSFSSQFEHPAGHYCFSENENNSNQDDSNAPSPASSNCVGDGCDNTNQNDSNASQSADQTPTPTPYYPHGGADQ